MRRPVAARRGRRSPGRGPYVPLPRRGAEE